MSLTYIVAFVSVFFRCGICFVFLLSFGRKVRDITQFQRSIVASRLLSRKLSQLAAIFFLGGVLAVVFCLLLGGGLLLPGFLLALLLLIVFSIALASVLRRKLSLSCHCFGDSDQPVAGADVWRNVGLVLYALVGSATTPWSQASGRALSIGEWFVEGTGGFPKPTNRCGLNALNSDVP